MTEPATTENSDSKPEGATENDSKPDLESLLASYGKGDGDKSAKPGMNEDVLGEVKALRTELAQRDYREVMRDDVIPTVKGDLDVPTDYVEYWVNKQADADPRLMEAWDNRKANPAAFKEVMEALAPKFQSHAEEQFGAKRADSSKPGSKLVSAVRSSRQSTPNDGGFDGVDWVGMSDHDLALKKREVFKAAERGEFSQ